jgi:hypothetical protein
MFPMSASGTTMAIGRTRNVMVYRLIAKGTVEERVMVLQAPQEWSVRLPTAPTGSDLEPAACP